MGDSWEVECSDEEDYGMKQDENGKYLPPPDIILSLYEKIDRGEEIGLEWTCPGRRPPTPEKQDEPEFESKPDEEKPMVKDEYLDFEVEKGHLTLRPAGDVGPRGSAKKKTTSLDAILSNMERYRRMDMMEEDVPE